ncbi:MAG: diguanylate cyclase [Azonexus sp.]
MTMLQKVLIVDASRVARASLARYLKGHFKVCEDVDGESAWQTMVLDSSIVAVIAGGHLERLDTFELVERARENKLCRLNRMPFFVVVSDSFSVEEKLTASRRGVTDFIPKSLPPADMDELINRLFNQAQLAEDRRLCGESLASPGPASLASLPPELSGPGYTGERSISGASNIMGGVGSLSGLPDVLHEINVKSSSDTGTLSREKFDARLRQRLAATGQAQPVGLLIFALDGYSALLARYGVELAERVLRKVSGLLAKKMRGEDSIGRLAPGQIAILTPQTSRALCTSFANRVGQALANAQISLRGQPLALTVSVGIAALPEDGANLSADDLLALAQTRLESAIALGGNRVFSGDCCAGQRFLDQEAFLGRLKKALAEATPEATAPCLGHVGLELLPLLRQLDQAMQFNLPLDEMLASLSERAEIERSGV